MMMMMMMLMMCVMSGSWMLNGDDDPGLGQCLNLSEFEQDRL